jgi:hypothetical protein
MKKFLDADHPFFTRVWVRWLTVIVCAGMAVLELTTGSPGWAMLFGAGGAWALYVLIYQGPSKG